VYATKAEFQITPVPGNEKAALAQETSAHEPRAGSRFSGSPRRTTTGRASRTGRQRDCRPRGTNAERPRLLDVVRRTCRRVRSASDSATSADAPAPRQRFESSCEGSWIEGQSRRWRQEPHRQSTPGAPRKGKSMYIGIGTVVLIVIIVLVILMLRRRLCRADAPASLSAAREKNHDGRGYMNRPRHAESGMPVSTMRHRRPPTGNEDGGKSCSRPPCKAPSSPWSR
jgi:hypothetical protein